MDTVELKKNLLVSILEFKDSDNYKKFLEFAGSFYSYSLHNRILIYYQKRSAKHIASFKKWQSMGRCVKKGEKALWILAPNFFKVKKENEEGKEEEKEKIFFRSVP